MESKIFSASPSHKIVPAPAYNLMDGPPGERQPAALASTPQPAEQIEIHGLKWETPLKSGTPVQFT
ncbi:conserved hypothetical protein [Ricinus communis]|uniref:Uncharacterized protein n=1 Tax=Ricinus communis TaxID=3988 RepID=B9T8F2_RICCO|nr:conserved hypothetical protein [Ricinus communis]